MNQTKFILILIAIFSFGEITAQSIDSLNARKAELRAEISNLEGELKRTISAFPPVYGWRTGFSGLLGFSLTDMNNWVSSANKDATTSNIQVSAAGFAHLIEEKFFWRNNAQLNLGWQKLNLKTGAEDESKYQSTVDVFQISSLYGYRISPTLAASALGEFRTSVINNIFDPAYLDIGVGFTWTPNANLVVTVHPLNYNFIFSDEVEYESSLGAKVVADYNREIFDGVNLRSNLTGFMSYEDASELSNFTWTTGVNFTAFKGIGVGVEYALRWNKQETRGLDDDMQSYFVLGLSYNF
ncbi:MAG: DUF3078 domain-containing protein [Saprospirales bacterium]|nr:MAG: DUF3078 domain-containing protein [Saprospirales bacterium]